MHQHAMYAECDIVTADLFICQMLVQSCETCYMINAASHSGCMILSHLMVNHLHGV